MSNKSVDILKNCRVCARIPAGADAAARADQAVRAGAEAIELCAAGAGFSEALEALVARHGQSVLIGAGNITSADTAFEAVDAGARFLATPLHDISIFKAGESLEVPVIAEALTPLELRRAVSLSARMVRLFPSCAVTPAYAGELAALGLPTALAAAGRISAEQVSALRRAGVTCFFCDDTEQLSDVIAAAFA